MDEQKSLDEDEMAAVSKLVELAKKPLPGLKDPRLEDGEDGVRRLYDGENLVAMGAAPEEEAPVCTQCAMPGPGMQARERGRRLRVPVLVPRGGGVMSEPMRTIADVAKRLGLEEPWSGDHFTRRSGKTTNMLLQAMLALQDGKTVFLRGYQFSFSMRLARQAKAWARKLGLDPEKIQPFRSSEDMYGRDAYLFDDHTELGMGVMPECLEYVGAPARQRLVS